ncbi:hypothetical protein [Caligus rogercresseyi rhabdovirus]|uniref:Uncharacterized protein n=1 Tax=Caligus rogercresseyi rhabdovirus TaxID=1921414 RepID=A0A1L2YZU8_9RHAB|nr:hypothetical protein [Caligus rogercresseyi rhabdovirus]APF32076.1 hypothetical protein [Caligus rogercresseyi rhabdovirus]
MSVSLTLAFCAALLCKVSNDPELCRLERPGEEPYSARELHLIALCVMEMTRDKTIEEKIFRWRTLSPSQKKKTIDKKKKRPPFSFILDVGQFLGEIFGILDSSLSAISTSIDLADDGQKGSEIDDVEGTNRKMNVV